MCISKSMQVLVKTNDRPLFEKWYRDRVLCIGRSLNLPTHVHLFDKALVFILWIGLAVFTFAQESNALLLSQAKAPIKILFAGDIMLDGGPGNKVANGVDPFEACSSLFDGVDLCIGNLECVLGRGGTKQAKPYVFRGATDSPRFLKKYFHAVSVANNHSLDYGPDGMVEMLAVLKREKLPSFGGGLDLKEAMTPFVIDIKGHRIAILGFNEFYAEDYAATDTQAGNAPMFEPGVTNAIKNAKDKLKCDVVIPYLHWGEEMVPTPRPDQTKMSKGWIEAGATAVVGTHPHIPQTLDIYRGAPIVYSLGNFAFDYFPVDPLEWIGWVVVFEIATDGTVGLEIKTIVLNEAGCPRPAPTE
jgi:poly-gamma-glutamate capsule biosynthesis protein CapA/YwtB (metallophosphatase superfamily)